MTVVLLIFDNFFNSFLFSLFLYMGAHVRVYMCSSGYLKITYDERGTTRILLVATYFSSVFAMLNFHVTDLIAFS